AQETNNTTPVGTSPEIGDEQENSESAQSDTTSNEDQQFPPQVDSIPEQNQGTAAAGSSTEERPITIGSSAECNAANSQGFGLFPLSTSSLKNSNPPCKIQ